jgi:hypothetical protein
MALHEAVKPDKPPLSLLSIRDEHNIQHSSHFDKLQFKGLINAVGQSSNTSNSILLALEFNVMVVKPCLY